MLDALYIPTRYPDSLPEGAPTDHFGRLQSSDAISHARALVEVIRLALASPEQVLEDVQVWALHQQRRVPSLQRLGVFGSYGWHGRLWQRP